MVSTGHEGYHGICCPSWPVGIVLHSPGRGSALLSAAFLFLVNHMVSLQDCSIDFSSASLNVGLAAVDDFSLIK